MSLIRNWAMIGVAVLVLTVGCQKVVPLDPRDADLDEELTRISREVNLHITSSYWGSVTVFLISSNSSIPIRIATVSNSSKERTFTISKARLGSTGRISLLLKPLASGGISGRWGNVRDQTNAPRGGNYAYILQDIQIGRYTEDIWLTINNQISTSSATWR